MAWYPEDTAAYNANAWHLDNVITFESYDIYKDVNKIESQREPFMWDDNDSYVDIEEEIQNALKDYILSSENELSPKEISEYRSMLSALAYDDDVSLDDMDSYAGDFQELDLNLELTATGKAFFDKKEVFSDQLSSYSLICCDQIESLCDCNLSKSSIIYSDFASSRSFLYVYNFLQREVADFEELSEWVYDRDDATDRVLCESCLHHGTYRCMPLRNWMRWIGDEAYNLTLPLPLDSSYAVVSPCNEFIAKSNIAPGEVDYIKNYIYNKNSLSKKENKKLEDYVSLENFVKEK